MKEVSVFINTAHLYLQMKMNEEITTTQITWILLYIQGGVAKAWKNNLLDKLAKEESKIEIVEALFKKITRGSGYERRPLIKEFKRELNGAIRRKLAKTKSLPTTIGE